MSDKKSAYGTPSGDTSFRRTWDKDEFRKQAEEKDEKARQHAKEAEEAMKKGRKPSGKHRSLADLPKPTEKMQAREGDLELEKNLGKTQVVAAGLRGASAPGFFCEACNRNFKDTVGYLDHLNSRGHLRHLGQSTKQKRSTLTQVRAKIAELRAQTAAKADAKKVDFDTRLRRIRQAEDQTRLERKAAKKAAKQEIREVPEGMEVDGNADLAAMMGFGGFK